MRFHLFCLIELNKEAAISIIWLTWCSTKDINRHSTRYCVCKYPKYIKRVQIKNDNIILLNPTLKNLSGMKNYLQLEYNNDTYWIPLWHNEISYDITSKDNQISNHNCEMYSHTSSPYIN